MKIEICIEDGKESEDAGGAESEDMTPEQIKAKIDELKKMLAGGRKARTMLSGASMEGED